MTELYISERAAYSEPRQTSKMKRFEKIQPSTIFAKRSILDVSQLFSSRFQLLYKGVALKTFFKIHRRIERVSLLIFKYVFFEFCGIFSEYLFQ